MNCLRQLLETVLTQNIIIEAMEVEHDFLTLGLRRMCLNARRLHSQTGGKELIFLAMEDVPDHPPGGPTGVSADQAGDCVQAGVSAR